MYYIGTLYCIILYNYTILTIREVVYVLYCRFERYWNGSAEADCEVRRNTYKYRWDTMIARGVIFPQLRKNFFLTGKIFFPNWEKNTG